MLSNDSSLCMSTYAAEDKRHIRQHERDSMSKRQKEAESEREGKTGQMACELKLGLPPMGLGFKEERSLSVFVKGPAIKKEH